MSQMNFSGTVTYDGLRAGTRINRLEFVDEKILLLDWINPPQDREGLVTRFLGVAERQENQTYKTPWVYLCDASGGDLANGWGARITFSIAELNPSELRISGDWIDFEEVKYPFNGLLSRVAQTRS